MKQTEVNSKLIETLAGSQRPLTPQDIHESTGIVFVQIHTGLKALVEEGQVTMEEKDNKKFYAVPGKRVEPIKEEVKKEESVLTKKEKPKAGRDVSKFSFLGNSYGKSQCVLMMLKHYVATKKPTFKKLKEVFPDAEIQPRYHVVRELKDAKKLSDPYIRFFLKEEQIITTSDGIKCASTNQYDVPRFQKFLEHASKVGLKLD